jgi:hypothetical protein
VCNPIGDHSEVLAFVERRLYAVIQLAVADELVKRIHVIADPQQLEVIGSQFPTEAGPKQGSEVDFMTECRPETTKPGIRGLHGGRYWD